MLHEYYQQLTRKEKQLVDDSFVATFKLFNRERVPLVGNDHVERAVDALSKAVIESRSASSPGGKPKISKSVRTNLQKANRSLSTVDRIRLNIKAQEVLPPITDLE
jgi:hypothetical protein